MQDVVHQLLVNEVAAEKLGARRISPAETEQMLRNRHVVVANVRGNAANRRLLIGRTDGGRAMTLVVEPTIDPTTWLLVTGWDSTPAERTILRYR